MILLLAACVGTTDDTGKAEPFDGNFVLTDPNNYSYTSDIEATAQEMKLATDGLVDWSGLTTDLLGHAMDPVTDVDLVWIVQFPNLSEDEVVEMIVTDSLLQEEVGPYIQFDNDPADVTSAMLSQFVFPPNNPIVPEEDFTDGSGTWLVRATTGLSENRMLGFMRPMEETENTTFYLDSDTSTLEFSADLQSLTSFTVDTPLTTYTADWSALETHANGNEIDLDLLDQLLIGKYDMTVSDIEAQFIDVETIASEIYTTDVYGLTSTDLSAAVDESGAAFAGFTTGTWLLALRCTACTNPAPPFVTVVTVE